MMKYYNVQMVFGSLKALVTAIASAPLKTWASLRDLASRRNLVALVPAKAFALSMGLFSLTTLAGCSSEEGSEGIDSNVMQFQVSYPGEQTPSTRVTDTAFESGDRVGLFLTTANELLESSGNYVNNAPLTNNGSLWNTDKPIYWNNGSYDAYAYYPYRTEVGSVDDYDFSVATDQRGEGYAASDFLFAQAKGLTASASPVQLQFAHRMSRILLQLVKSSDYEGELPDEAEVMLHNTVPSATIDLKVGVVTRNVYGQRQSIRCKSLGNHRYSAIVVPQRIDNRMPLVEVVMKGVSYLYESKFLFKPGVQHMVQLVISKNPDQLKIEIGGEIENWD